MWRVPFTHLFAKHQQIFDSADQIGPDWGFNAGRASGARRRHRYPERCALKAQTLGRRYGDLPDARDGHLLRLTGSAGMLQHATFTIPNYRHGYCTDDNQNELLGIGRTHIVSPSADD
jgi:hypothetical protein